MNLDCLIAQLIAIRDEHGGDAWVTYENRYLSHEINSVSVHTDEIETLDGVHLRSLHTVILS